MPIHGRQVQRGCLGPVNRRSRRVAKYRALAITIEGSALTRHAFSNPTRRKALMARQVAYAILAALALLAISAAAYDWYTPLPPDTHANTPSTSAARRAPSAIRASSIVWHGSHHDRAMEIATEETVLGDFNDAVFERLGVTTRFFRRDGKFFVNTEGPDGENHDYEIKYTFGIDPLQQYMVEFPDGRVQVLRVSWDTQQEAVVRSHAARRPQRTAAARRPAPLDRHRPELEHHLRRVPFDEPAEELRSRHRHLSHHVQRDRRQLRRVPRPGERPRRRWPIAGRRSGTATSATACANLKSADTTRADRNLCQMPFAPAHGPRRLPPRPAAARLLRARAALRRPVPRRRPDSRRSLRVRLVPRRARCTPTASAAPIATIPIRSS